jgi:intein/homing endonuclease
VKTPYVEAMGRLVEVPAKNDELSRSSVHISDGMVVTPVVKIDVADVVDYEVRNLEVDGDNSYVAANIAVHNCVFCGLCIDPDTPVVTNPGLKPMKEVKVGDLLLTHTGEYKPVTKVWDMRYTGTLYRIHVYGKPEPLVCTADHPIMAVSRRMSKGKDGGLSRSTEPLKFHKPGELKPGDYLVSPVVKKERPVETYEKDVPLYKIGPV